MSEVRLETDDQIRAASLRMLALREALDDGQVLTIADQLLAVEVAYVALLRLQPAEPIGQLGTLPDWLKELQE